MSYLERATLCYQTNSVPKSTSPITFVRDPDAMAKERRLRRETKMRQKKIVQMSMERRRAEEAHREEVLLKRKHSIPTIPKRSLFGATPTSSCLSSAKSSIAPSINSSTVTISSAASKRYSSAPIPRYNPSIKQERPIIKPIKSVETPIDELNQSFSNVPLSLLHESTNQISHKMIDAHNPRKNTSPHPYTFLHKLSNVTNKPFTQLSMDEKQLLESIARLDNLLVLESSRSNNNQELKVAEKSAGKICSNTKISKKDVRNFKSNSTISQKESPIIQNPINNSSKIITTNGTKESHFLPQLPSQRPVKSAVGQNKEAKIVAENISFANTPTLPALSNPPFSAFFANQMSRHRDITVSSKPEIKVVEKSKLFRILNGVSDDVAVPAQPDLIAQKTRKPQKTSTVNDEMFQKLERFKIPFTVNHFQRTNQSNVDQSTDFDPPDYDCIPERLSSPELISEFEDFSESKRKKR
ncbi:hypothetical protein RCL1_006160 [Eukaryota sp. TZLM3-RCL]